MKTSTSTPLLFFLLLILASFSLKAQWVNIPDSNFGNWLYANGYNQCLTGNSITGWRMDTTCNAVVSASTVNCYNAGVKDISGIQYFDSLKLLTCSANQLTALPNLPRYLEELYCENNMLSGLPPLPTTLTWLMCSHNNILSFPALPVKLRWLECEFNSLFSLPALPDSLRLLKCLINNLSSLPSLPQNLGVLTCSYNQITSLPTLPNSITYFDCSRNQLTSLPTLPSQVYTFDCSYNQLTSLPSIPNSIVNLNCSNNHLTSLSLPNTPLLTFVDCSNNLLTTLIGIPSNVAYLYCNDNLLSKIGSLPPTMQDFYCSNNPNLFCLPPLGNIKYLYYEQTAISCLPNFPTGNTWSQPMLNTISLCDIYNEKGCDLAWNVRGVIYLDSQQNCLVDSAEYRFRNIGVNQYEGGNFIQQHFSLFNGEYAFNILSNTSTYSVDTSVLPFSIVCPDSGSYTSTLTSTDSVFENMDFGFRCKPGFDLVAQSVVNLSSFRPGKNTSVQVWAGDAANYYGASCITGLSGQVQLIIQGQARYSYSPPNSLPPTTIIGDTLTWNVSDFGLVNFSSDFNIVTTVDTTAQIGQQVCFTLLVNPIAGDNNPANNLLTTCYSIVNSFDPNDKSVYPAGAIDTAQEWLTYTIRFQNTGNYEAQHIYITDYLDNNLDEGSIRLMSYSHQPLVVLVGKKLRFNFPNIYLPDSFTNEPASHGYVQYKIKRKENLPIGTSIFNTANIYFDYNAPIATNTVTTTIGISSSVQSIEQGDLNFQIFPNPSTGFFSLIADKKLVGSSCSIYDLMGRQLLRLTLQNSVVEIPSGFLSEGIYLVQVLTANGTMTTKKLIIRK